MERLYNAVTTPYDQLSTNTDLFKPILSTIQSIEKSIQSGGDDEAPPGDDGKGEAPPGDAGGDPGGDADEDAGEDPAVPEAAGAIDKLKEGGKKVGKAILNKDKMWGDMKSQASKVGDSIQKNKDGDCGGGVGSMITTLFKFIFYIIVFPLLPWFYITKVSYQKLQQINSGITQPL
jgi:hypothetical protein